MKRSAKLVSCALIASMLVGTVSCSAKFEESVLEAADSLGKYIVDRNYKKIEKMADEGDDALEAVLSLSEEGTDDSIAAREIIASTLEYEVDKKSYDGDTMGKEGSVDVVFTYVDYESVTEDVIFTGVDQFEETVGDCKDTVEVTITFEFINDGGKTVCTNIDDIADLFPYSDEEFTFALPFDEYVDGITFVDCGSDYVYTDVDSITCTLGVIDEGQELTWDYTYKVSCDDAIVFESDVITVESPTSLEATYSVSSGLIPDGMYTFDFYTADGDWLYAACVTVTHTEATPTPAPSSGTGTDTAATGPINPGPYFVCPSDGVIDLEGTNLRLTLSDDFICRDVDDQLFIESYSGSPNEQNIVCFAASIDTAYRVTVFRIGGYDYTESANDQFAIGVIDEMETQCSAIGATCTRSEDEYMLDGQTYNSYSLHVVTTYEDIYFSAIIVGDSDDSYMIYSLSQFIDMRDIVLQGLEVV